MKSSPNKSKRNVTHHPHGDFHVLTVTMSPVLCEYTSVCSEKHMFDCVCVFVKADCGGVLLKVTC